MPFYLLVANPMSSRGLGQRQIAEVARRLSAGGADVDIRLTSKRGDAEAIAARADGDCRAIVAIGGDGTVGEVVNGLAGRPVPIGVIPRGTGNVLAKELGIPFDPLAAADVIVSGNVVRMDAGMAGGRRFVLVASAGFDAEVVALAHRHRKGRFGYMHYVIPILWALVRGRFPEIRVEADGREYVCRHVMAANVSSYGGPLKIADEADYRDGLFDVIMYRSGGRLALLRHAASALLRKTVRGHDVERVRAHSVSLSSERSVALQLDGDPAGLLPVSLEVMRCEVMVLAPARGGAEERQAT